MAAAVAAEEEATASALEASYSESEETARLSEHSICSDVPGRGGVLHEGWLFKQGTINTAWKKRWFVMRTGRLEYYTTEKHTDFKGAFLLSSMECFPADSPANGFFVTKSDGGSRKRNVLLKASSPEDRATWLRVLQEDASPPIMTGWLQKRGHVVTTFKRRFFVLDSTGRLHYFKSADGEWKGAINMLHAHIMVDETDDKDTEFIIDTKHDIKNGEQEDVQFTLQAGDRKERIAWVKALRGVGLEGMRDGSDLDGYVSMQSVPDPF